MTDETATMLGGKRETERLVTMQQAESVVRGQARTIVAALDESEYADTVFAFLTKHYNSPATKVVFTYVARPVDSLFKSYAADANEAQAKRYLAEGWVTRAADLGLEMQCEGRVLVGDPREELQLFCEHLQPDALIIGSHGRGALGRMMLGSVSDYLVHHCPCAVVVVKPPKEEGKSGYSSVFRLMGTSMLSFRRSDKKEAEGVKEEGEAEKKEEEGEKKEEEREKKEEQGEKEGPTALPEVEEVKKGLKEIKVTEVAAPAENAEVQPTGAQPIEAQPTGEQPTEAQAAAAQPIEAQPTGEQATEVEPTGPQPAEMMAKQKQGEMLPAVEVAQPGGGGGSQATKAPPTDTSERAFAEGIKAGDKQRLAA